MRKNNHIVRHVKILTFLMVFMMAALYFSAKVVSQEPSQERKRLIIGGDYNAPPYEYLENSKPIGFSVDLSLAVAEVMDLDVEIRLGNWDEIRRDFEKGKIDIITGMAYSKERDEYLGFSTPHHIVSQAIFVRKQSSISSLEDIKDKEIIVQNGDIMHDYVKENNLSAKVIVVEDQTNALRLLASGKHDCALLMKLQGLYNANKLNLTNIKVVDPPIMLTNYCFVVSEGNTTLLSQLNEGLSIIHETGKFKEIHDKWFGVYIKPVYMKIVFKYVVFILLPLLLLLIAAFGWSVSLRKLVKRKTLELQTELYERANAEKSLFESEDRFRNLFNSTFEGIFTHEDGYILEVNEPAATLVGYIPEELVGRSVLDIISEESRETIIKNVAIAKKNPDLIDGPYEIIVLKKNGTKIPVEVHSKGITYKGRKVRLAGFRDMSDRHRMERALKESEAKFRAITENTTDITIIIGEDGTYKYCSPSVIGTSGFSPEDVQGNSPKDFVISEDLDKVDEAINTAVLHPGKTILLEEFRGKRKDGEISHFQGLFTSMLDIPGVNGVVINCRDITERVTYQRLLSESERRLRRMNDELVSIANNKTIMSGDVKAAFKEITEAAAKTLEVSTSSIWLNSSKEECFKCHDLFENESNKHLKGFKASKMDALTEKIHEIDENRIVAVENIDDDEYYKEVYARYFPDAGVTSTIKAQIRIGGEAFGILSIDHTGPPRKWTIEEQNFVGSLADIGSIAIETSERMKAEKSLEKKIAFETLMSRIASKFMDLSPSDIDIGINHALQKTGEFLSVDRVYVYLFSDDQTRMSNTHEWFADGLEAQIDNLQDLDTSKFPWWMDKLKELKIVNIPSVDNLPEDAIIEKEILQSFNVKSELVVPFEYQKSLFGYVGFDKVTSEEKWTDDCIKVLEHLGWIITDALEHKQLHEELQKANEELEAKVEARTRELHDKQAKLVQAEKMAALGNLVAGVAHEINTPLGALKSNNDVFIRSVSKMKNIVSSLTGQDGSSLDPDLDKLFTSIDKLNEVSKTASDRIVKIVKSLRTFARLDQADMDTVDIHEGIESTLTLVHHELKRRIEVHREFGDLPKISCYPNQLNQVFMNLLVNASQAIEDKGDIYIKTFARDTDVVIEVRDTGKGISEDKINQIFDPGYTTKSKGIGTGLGLSIVYQIIASHNGTIHVESEIGKGSVFKIVLPIRNAE